MKKAFRPFALGVKLLAGLAMVSVSVPALEAAVEEESAIGFSCAIRCAVESGYIKVVDGQVTLLRDCWEDERATYCVYY